MKSSNQFVIKIENQRWLDHNNEEDLCSHGEIYLNVNGNIITQFGINEEWGISESALALLRTMDQDYRCDPNMEEGLILHGCGTVLMTGCPISIHWSVKHMNDQILLSDFVKITTTDPATGNVYYPDLHVTLHKNEYKDQVVLFASQVKNFFATSKQKRISGDLDKEMYQSFWEEYNLLLANS
ncbi:hypothetical protein [Gracilibacillus alcaliphilus]|uniref:hypothetical protein n=1 Tax=Gracilibacillus alcaliphilus TaxID=1401441 RepID=UPI0019578EEC|nr:hypothetical protein [Gracilibacillus alcaliphilus]MBM7679380.1 hypothetical protein [Gracilibacillus alcaliphilus]